MLPGQLLGLISSHQETSAPQYTSGQKQLGMAGLGLLVAIKRIGSDRQAAIADLQHEIQLLSQYPEPEMRGILRVALSFLMPNDWAALLSVQEEVEFMTVLGGPEQAA